MADVSELPGVEVGFPGAIRGANVPKRMSPKSFPICHAKWSWSPANSRNDTYYLHSGRADWFLWLSFSDGCDGETEHSIIGRIPKSGIDADAASKALLEAFWQYNSTKSELNRPHSCDPGVLSGEALEEIIKAVWGIQTVIPLELVKAYETTEFRVLEPRAFTLRVGYQSIELNELFVQLGVTCAGYLTAWNPFSAKTSAEDNAAAQKSLIQRLSQEGYQTFKALGVDPADKWQGEESFFVPGLDLKRTKLIGNEFGQSAIVWVGDDAIPQLVLLR